MSETAFQTGVSTDEEVSKLMQLNLQPGEVIPYQRIATMSGIRYGTSRFRTVVQAWTRRVFREQRLQHESVRGVGLRFLTEPQALAKGVKDNKIATRAQRRVATRVKHIDSRQLSEYERTQRELLQAHLRAMDSAARKLSKKIAAPQPVKDTVVQMAG